MPQFVTEDGRKVSAHYDGPTGHARVSYDHIFDGRLVQIIDITKYISMVQMQFFTHLSDVVMTTVLF